MTSYRLARGGLVDRRTRLNFTFDGKALAGLEGDLPLEAQPASGIVEPPHDRVRPGAAEIGPHGDRAGSHLHRSDAKQGPILSRG